MSLRPLVPGIAPENSHLAVRCGLDTPGPDTPCVHCGCPIGVLARAAAGGAACALCGLASHLERPHVDEEADLIWLPGMSQVALNVTIREMHLHLRGLGEDLHARARPRVDTPRRRRIHHAHTALIGRAEAAATRLGTHRPSELGHALSLLSPSAQASRFRLLGGIRLLPSGRFLDDTGRDVYPAIVDAWRGLSTPSPEDR